MDTPYIVYNGHVHEGKPGWDHHDLNQSGRLHSPDEFSDGLRVFYDPGSKELSVSSHSLEDMKGNEGMRQEFEALQSHLEKKYKTFGLDTPVYVFSETQADWHQETWKLGELYHHMSEPKSTERVRPEFSRPESSIEGYYPSGTPIRFGDRRPVKVRGHLRRRIVHHLENPSAACFCHRSKSVDRVRRSMIRRMR